MQANRARSRRAGRAGNAARELLSTMHEAHSPAVSGTVSNPFVFALGCPRSGTTLLRRLLNAHGQLAVPKAETHWIPKFFAKGRGLTPDGQVQAAFIDVLLDYDRFRKFGIGRSELEGIIGGREAMPYAEFVAGLFDLYGARRGKRLVGDKTPGYVRFMPVLHELFPQARFIHLVRDGRDVALSMLNWNRLHKTAGRIGSFADDPVTTTALFWEWLVRLGLEAAEDLPARHCLLVRYESLIAETGRCCEEMCDFLGLAWDPAMLAFHEGRRREGDALSAKKAWLPPTQGLRDWRSQMPEADILKFEAAAGPLLDELGYERRFSAIPGDALAHAETLRAAFDRKPHPRAWDS